MDYQDSDLGLTLPTNNSTFDLTHFTTAFTSIQNYINGTRTKISSMVTDIGTEISGIKNKKVSYYIVDSIDYKSSNRIPVTPIGDSPEVPSSDASFYIYFSRSNRTAVNSGYFKNASTNKAFPKGYGGSGRWTNGLYFCYPVTGSSVYNIVRITSTPTLAFTFESTRFWIEQSNVYSYPINVYIDEYTDLAGITINAVGGTVYIDGTDIRSLEKVNRGLYYATDAHHLYTKSRAIGDESGNNIKASYGASLSLSSTNLALVNKNGQNLTSLTQTSLRESMFPTYSGTKAPTYILGITNNWYDGIHIPLSSMNSLIGAAPSSHTHSISDINFVKWTYRNSYGGGAPLDSTSRSFTVSFPATLGLPVYCKLGLIGSQTSNGTTIESWGSGTRYVTFTKGNDNYYYIHIDYSGTQPSGGYHEAADVWYIPSI